MTDAQNETPASVRTLDPIVAQDNAFFWEAAKRGAFITRACDKCGYFTHPPVPMCPRCHGLAWTEKALSGKGIVSGWLKVHHPQVPIFTYPNLIVTVELEEGIEMVSSLVEAGGVEVVAGLPVEVVFAPTSGGWALPLFRPRAADAA